MSPEHERTWRDLVAEAAEQKRRAELFPELVAALDTTLTYVQAWVSHWQAMHLHKLAAPSPAHQATIDRTTALLVRCRKPKP